MIANQERIKCHKLKKFCDQSRSINVAEIWKMKKKMWPSKPTSLPQAKINHKGKLISSGRDIKCSMLKEYKERLRSRPKHPLSKKLFKPKILNYKLNIAKENISEPISMKELDFVLSKTKTGKARDPEGLVREIFRPQVIGQDLKISMLSMLNTVKTEGIFLTS